MSSAPADRGGSGSQLLSLPARAYLWLMAFAAMGFLAYWQQAWSGTVPSDLTSLGLMAALMALAAVAQHFPR